MDTINSQYFVTSPDMAMWVGVSYENLGQSVPPVTVRVVNMLDPDDDDDDGYEWDEPWM
jgi:hypothetical protein